MELEKQTATATEGETSPAPKRRAWRWEITAAIAVVFALAAVAMPTYTSLLNSARTAEGKQSLHDLQLAVERYGVDHGAFPEYLIGGQPRFRSLESSDYDATGEVKDCFATNLISDPLLREGYLASYPRNPFITDSPHVHDLQLLFGDELRNGTSAAAMHGTRFGPDCNLMGNVLADFRYTTFKAQGAEFRSYADTEYPFFDTERRYFQPGFIPGMFFYKSVGVLMAGREYLEEETPIKPRLIEYYIMGLYGSPRSPGRDVLGPEPLLHYMAYFPKSEYPKSPLEKSGRRLHYVYESDENWIMEFQAPAWTRSSSWLKDKDGLYLGSPYGPT